MTNNSNGASRENRTPLTSLEGWDTTNMPYSRNGAPTRNRTEIPGLQGPGNSHYTIRAKLEKGVGVEPI